MLVLSNKLPIKIGSLTIDIAKNDNISKDTNLNDEKEEDDIISLKIKEKNELENI